MAVRSVLAVVSATHNLATGVGAGVLAAVTEKYRRHGREVELIWLNADG